MQGSWIGKNDVDGVWDKVEPFVIKALKRWIPAWRPSDLKEYIKADTMQLWVVYDEEEKKIYGVCMTQVMKYPLMKMFQVFLIGGTEFKKWRNMWCEEADRRAKEEGCEILQASGRRGWLHIPGAFESAVVINKILN